MKIPIAKFEQQSSVLEINQESSIEDNIPISETEKTVPLDHSWYCNHLLEINSLRKAKEPGMLENAKTGKFEPMLGQGQIVTLKIECKDPYISQMLFKALEQHELMAGCIIHKLFLSDLEDRLESLKRRMEDGLKLDRY